MPSATHRAVPAGLLLAGILLVAANLRPVITAVGPVLPVIGKDTGLSAAELGVLAAVPLIAFAVVSPMVHRLGRRLGVDRAVLVALLFLALGTLVRSVPGQTLTLWTGTALIGAAVAVGNVLLPVVVKRDFPLRVPSLTGLYISSQSLFAALASGLAVPLAAVASWHLALGAWVVLILVAVALWLPRLRGSTPRPMPATTRTGAGREHPAAVRTGPAGTAPSVVPPLEAATSAPPQPDALAAQAWAPEPPTPGATAGAMVSDPPVRVSSVWRSWTAWQVALYLGLQSTVFYTMVNWLPTAEQDLGVDPVVAGWHHSVFQAVSIVGSLTAPALMRLGGDQRLATTLTPALMVTAMLGLVLAPGFLLLWVVLVGLSTGGAFTTALSLLGLRAADAATAGKLSSMGQGVGYLVAAVGLVGVGTLRDLTGPGPLLLLCVAGVASAQLLLGLLAGRNYVLSVERTSHRRTTTENDQGKRLP